MNREILFRGMRCDNCEWACGNLMVWGSGKTEIFSVVGKKGVAFNEVFPTTVGQYTGLKDRNGKRVFEGDVVEFPNMRGNHKFRIYWSDDIASFCMKHIGEQLQWTPCCNLGTVATCTVVGNIHDNEMEV